MPQKIYENFTPTQFLFQDCKNSGRFSITLLSYQMSKNKNPLNEHAYNLKLVVNFRFHETKSKNHNIMQKLASIHPKNPSTAIPLKYKLKPSKDHHYYQIMHLWDVVELRFFVWIQVTERNCWKRLLSTDYLN